MNKEIQTGYDSHTILCDLIGCIESKREEISRKHFMEVSILELGQDAAYLDVQIMILKLVNGG